MTSNTINHKTLAAAMESGNVDVRFALHWIAIGNVAEAVYRDLDTNSSLGIMSCAFVEAHSCNESLSYKQSRTVHSLTTAIRSLMRASSETHRAGLGRLLTTFVDINDIQTCRAVIYDFAACFGGPDNFLNMFWEHTDTFINAKYNRRSA